MHRQPVTVVALLIPSPLRLIRERLALLVVPQVSSISFLFELGRQLGGGGEGNGKLPCQSRELWRWRSKHTHTHLPCCPMHVCVLHLCTEKPGEAVADYFIAARLTRRRFTAFLPSQGHMTPSCPLVSSSPRHVLTGVKHNTQVPRVPGCQGRTV